MSLTRNQFPNSVIPNTESSLQVHAHAEIASSARFVSRPWNN